MRCGGWFCGHHYIDGRMGPVRVYSRGVHIVMELGEYLMDLLPRLEEERRADTDGPRLNIPPGLLHFSLQKRRSRRKHWRRLPRRTGGRCCRLWRMAPASSPRN